MIADTDDEINSINFRHDGTTHQHDKNRDIVMFRQVSDPVGVKGLGKESDYEKGR